MAWISKRVLLGLLLGMLLIGLAVYFFLPQVKAQVAAWLGASTSEQNSPSTSSSPVVVASGEVDVEGGLLSLTFPQAGIVREVSAKEGQPVRAGDSLASLDARQLADQVVQAQARLRSSTIRLQQARRAVAEHALKVKLAAEAIKEAQARVEAQEAREVQVNQLVEKDLASPSEVRSARAQLNALRAALRIAELHNQQLGLERPEEAVQLAEAEQQVASAALDIAKDQEQGGTLRAPSNGVVLRILVQPGRTLSDRETAVWFLPDRPWIVRCEIDQQYISRVAKGMSCDIKDDRSGSLLAQGTVDRCADWVAPRRSVVTDESTPRRDARTVECLVAVSGSSSNLRVGQRVRVIVKTQPPVISH
jgi:multidrug resistance efflux pump